MKHNLKNYLKLGILLFGITLILVNCQHDDLTNSNQDNQNVIDNNFIIKPLGSKGILKNKTIIQKINELNKKPFKKGMYNKSVLDTVTGIEIDTDYANYLEYPNSGYHSYTFMVMNTPEGGGLENVFLSLQEDGTYKEFLVHYDVTDFEIELMNSNEYVDLENKIHMTELAESSFSDSAFNKVYYDGSTGCTYSTVWIEGNMCSENQHDYSGYNICRAATKPTQGYYNNTLLFCNVGGIGGEGHHRQEEAIIIHQIQEMEEEVLRALETEQLQ